MHPATTNRGIYLHLPKNLQIPEIAETPTEEDITRAKGWVNELLHDFPFIDQREKANAIGIFVEPFLREMILGPTPLRLIEASSAGSGKGLLADVLTRHATGQPGVISQCQTDEEWNKTLISQLKKNVQVILIDNITTSLDSGSLASILTAEYYGGRILGTNESGSWPNRALWLATGNNPIMTTEIARRTVRIRLDPKQDRPWQRVGFKHDDLREWASSHKPDLTWAALTLIQNWIAAGRPYHTVNPWVHLRHGVKRSVGSCSQQALRAFWKTWTNFMRRQTSRELHSGISWRPGGKDILTKRFRWPNSST
jgi:putative DNA primase/helicase